MRSGRSSASFVNVRVARRFLRRKRSLSLSGWRTSSLSVVGIVMGLTSSSVVGAAREIQSLLLPLAGLGIALLMSRRFWTRSR
jgi:hypothetical protein